MNQIDKISQEAHTLLQYSKDVVTTNLSTANNSGMFKPGLSNEQLIDVFNVIEQSLTQGFQKGLLSFQKTVKLTLKQTPSEIHKILEDASKNKENGETRKKK